MKYGQLGKKRKVEMNIKIHISFTSYYFLKYYFFKIIRRFLIFLFSGLDSEKFKKKNNCILSSGYGHTALIRNDSVYTWGQTTKGCLGHGPTMSRYTTPTPVSWLSSFKLEVSMVACGKHHTLALTNSGVRI